MKIVFDDCTCEDNKQSHDNCIAPTLTIDITGYTKGLCFVQVCNEKIKFVKQ